MWIKTAEGTRWGIHIHPRLNVPGGIVVTAPVIKVAFSIGGIHSPGGIVAMAPVIKVAFGIGGVLDVDVIPRVARAVVGVLNPYVHGDSVTIANIWQMDVYMGLDGGGNHLMDRLSCGTGLEIAVCLSNIIVIFRHKSLVGILSIHTIIHATAKPAYVLLDLVELTPEGPNVLGNPTGQLLKLVLDGVEAMPGGIKLTTNEVQVIVNALNFLREGPQEGVITWVQDGDRGATVKESCKRGTTTVKESRSQGTIVGNRGRGDIIHGKIV
jgi:hypothetical protein